jgi:hypothetical protein
VDLSSPFTRPGTGFLASLLVPSDRDYAYVAVHNRRLAMAAGYVFDAKRFPWIALWEENCARSYPPWDGATRVRGVEFGTSPMPLGLEQARQMRALFDTPVLASIPAHAGLETEYLLFASKVPESWTRIEDVKYLGRALTIRAQGGDEIAL